MLSFSLQKEERLKSRKIISRLFKEGKSIKSYPLRVVWLEIQPSKSEYPVQFAMAVPRRAFPKANERNLLKRRIREAYRLNKDIIYKELDTRYHVALVYQHARILPFSEIEEKLITLLKRLKKIS